MFAALGYPESKIFFLVQKYKISIDTFVLIYFIVYCCIDFISNVKLDKQGEKALLNLVRKKKSERDFFLRKARKTRKENDWSTYCRLRNSVTRSIRHSKATYTRSILQVNIDRPKQFWDKIKRCFPKNSINKENNKVFEVNGKQTSDLKAISNGFCTFFANIGKALQKAIPSLRDNIWKHHDYATMKQTLNPESCRFHFKPTNRNGVWAILRKTKSRKAPGHDDIPTCMIIDGADEISAPLSEMINHCLETSVFLSDEEIAKVTLIYMSCERS